MANVDQIAAFALLTDESTARLSAAEANANKALSLAPDDAYVHLVLGGIYILTNRAVQGIAECEHALALDRNIARAHGAIGWAKALMGRAAETEGHVLEALRLSPRDLGAHLWMYFMGAAKMHLAADAEAVGWLRRSIETNHNFPPAHFALAAALGLLGALDEARAAARGDLRSTLALPSAACSPPDQATIRRSLRGRSAPVRACEWPGCRRDDVGDGSFATGSNRQQVRPCPLCRRKRK